MQTYFVLFFKTALKSEAFRRFWRRLPYVNNKTWVIKNCEVGLSHTLARHKLHAEVLCPYWKVAERVLAKIEDRPRATEKRDSRGEVLATPSDEFIERLHANLIFGRPLNATHYFWDSLIADFRAPFIKRELVLGNPEGIAYAWRWPDLIAREYGYDAGPIRRHSAGRMRRRARLAVASDARARSFALQCGAIPIGGIIAPR